MNYTNRHIEESVVKAIETESDGYVIVETDHSSVFSFMPDAGKPMMRAGDKFELELRGISQVTGVKFNGDWLMRKSDEDLAAEHEAFRASFKARNEEKLERNRDNWQAREDALPEWIRVRLRNFHERGGHVFEAEGWGYELIISELAVMYRESGGEDTSQIMEYAALHGTSGNQHAVAQLLGRLSDDEVAGVISALTPLGAHPFYEEES